MTQKVHTHTHTFYPWYTNKLIIENCQMLNNKIENTTSPITISGYVYHDILQNHIQKESIYIFFSLYSSVYSFTFACFNCYLHNVNTCFSARYQHPAVTFAPYVDTHFACLLLAYVHIVALLICLRFFSMMKSCYKHLHRWMCSVCGDNEKKKT